MVSEVAASKDDGKPPLEYLLRQQTYDKPLQHSFSLKVISGDRVLITLLEGDPDPIDYIADMIKSSGKLSSDNAYCLNHSKFY